MLCSGEAPQYEYIAASNKRAHGSNSQKPPSPDPSKIRLPTALAVNIEDQKHRCDSDQHVLTCLSSTGFERYLAPLVYRLLKSCIARSVEMIQDVSIPAPHTCNCRKSKALPQEGPRMSGANIGSLGYP